MLSSAHFEEEERKKEMYAMADDRTSADRGRAVEAALANIEKKFGKGSIMRLGERDVSDVPAISTIRPRGTPPTPIAASRLSEVVEIAGISDTSRSPNRIIDPLPNFFSMLAKAASTARPRSAVVRSSATVSYTHLTLPTNREV